MTNISAFLSHPSTPATVRLRAIAIGAAALGAVALASSASPPQAAFRNHAVGRSTAPVALQAANGPAVIDHSRSTAPLGISGSTSAAPGNSSRSTAPITLW
jgi:hypothetical protein